MRPQPRPLRQPKPPTKLEAAQRQFESGQLVPAINQLEALLHQVDALEGKKLTAAEAEPARRAERRNNIVNDSATYATRRAEMPEGT